jgi:hypothetical protein
MTMPGFAAESAVYDKREHYVSRMSISVPPHAITAQLFHRPQVLCDTLVCYQHGGHWVCYCGS